METQLEKPYYSSNFKDCTFTCYLQDCLEGMRNNILDKSVDVVVTSPPYNIGVKYNRYEDRLPRENYLEFISNLGATISRVLTDDGSFFINVGGKPSDPWIPFDVANALRPYFMLQNRITWRIQKMIVVYH